MTENMSAIRRRLLHFDPLLDNFYKELKFDSLLLRYRFRRSTHLSDSRVREGCNIELLFQSSVHPREGSRLMNIWVTA